MASGTTKIRPSLIGSRPQLALKLAIKLTLKLTTDINAAPIPTPHGTAHEKITLQLVFSPRNFSSCKDATRDLENILGVVGRDSLAGKSLHSPQGSPMVSRFRGCHFVAF